MAFLDNSGDIILDAVLTDTGRMRLARGDGSFRIAKFAFGDDEINYELFRNSNHASGVHPSGSAYYDLEILQTPVLEAFTNNASMLKSKLLSIPRTNLLYLPVLLLNEARSSNDTDSNALLKLRAIIVDKDTEQDFAGGGDGLSADGEIWDVPGILNGYNTGNNSNGSNYIRLDQGLDTTEISSRFALDADLIETSYIVEIDNRFGSIVAQGGERANPSFIDDDNIATYHFVHGQDIAFVSASDSSNPIDDGGSQQVIAGPRGTVFTFKIRASLELNSSNYLFTKLGGTMMSNALGTGVVLRPGKSGYADGGAAGSADPGTAAEMYYTDTNVRVIGGTTGYSMDIPIRFIKKKK